MFKAAGFPRVRFSTFCAAITFVAVVGVTLRAADALPEWPMFTGPQGNFSQPASGVTLTTDLGNVKRLWTSEARDIPRGKMTTSWCSSTANPGTPFSGGTASLIVAQNTVFASFFVPTGTVIHQSCATSLGSALNETARGRLGILADDVLLAVDALTGKTRWRAVQSAKGASRPPTKRGGWGVSPVYYNGRIYSMGTTGRVYAYNAADGTRVWEKATGSAPRLQEALDSALSLRKYLSEMERPFWINDNLTSMVAADGVIIAPSDWGGLAAFDPLSGERLWEKGGQIRGTATPAVCAVGGKQYLLCNTSGDSLRMVDPKTGNALWSIKTGTYLGTVVAQGDVFICNSKPTPDKTVLGLYGAYRASTSGAKLLWQLPDQTQYRHEWWLDSGALRKVFMNGDHAYIVMKNAAGERLLAVRLSDGAVVKDIATPYSSWGVTLTYADGRLFVAHDQSHPGDVDPFQVFSATPELRDYGKWTPPHRSADGYEVPMLHPIVGGIAFFRTGEFTIAAYDLRANATVSNLPFRAANQTARFTATLHGRIDVNEPAAKKATLLDLNGRVLSVARRVGSSLSVGMAGVPPGAYLIRLHMADGTSAQHLLSMAR